MYKEPLFQIDLDKILKEKAPRLAKKLPRFSVNWLKKIVHQEDCNDVLRYVGEAKGVEAMNKMVEYFNLTLHLKDTENLPEKGKYIFVSNHPLGGLDGIALSSVIGERYNGQIKYIVNDILYFLKPLQPIFIPINKHGAQSKKSATIINEALQSDDQLVTFPAGLCSRKLNGKIEDPDWKKMFILKAVEHQRDIVPVFFEGRNSKFFYQLALWRKKLGIKFNIEMLLLPSEVFKQRNATFAIRFGKPIAWQTFNASKSPQQWADYVKQAVYQMERFR